MTDSATTAWKNAVVAAGGTVSAGRETLVDNLIVGLKADGIFSKLDRLWLFKAENSQSALIDLVANAVATATNSPTFTADQGYAGNGSTSYLTLSFNPNLGAHFTQDAADVIAWCNTVAAVSADIVGDIGSGGSIGSIYPRYGGDNHQYYNITGSQQRSPGIVSDGSGLFVATRTGASASALYRNGSQQYTGSESSASIINATSWRACGGQITSSTAQCAAVGMGGGLSGTDQANLYTRLNTYMATVAWEAAVVAAGGSVSSARRTLVSNLIYGLTKDGIWSKLDRLWLFKAENSQSALIDIVAASAATAVNSPTFTANAGYTGNGSTSSIDSNYNLPGGGLFSQNSACYFAWDTNPTPASAVACIAGAGASAANRILPNLGGNTYWSINTSQQPDSNSSSGFFLVNRTSSTVSTLDVNGIQVGSNATASILAGGNLMALTDSVAFTTDQVACLGLGSGLSGSERTAIYTRLNTYMAGGAGPVTDTITVTQASVLFTGKTVTIRDTDLVPVGKASVTFTGKAVTIIDLAPDVIPVGKGNILFSGQNIVISTTGEQPPILLPGGGGGVSVPPWRDLDRKKRRRYRALEEIEQRLDVRIERLEAESQEKQQQVAAAQTQIVVPDRLDDLLAQQAAVNAELREAQRRAQQVREEKVQLAQLARLNAAEAADEDEAITLLLLSGL